MTSSATPVTRSPFAEPTRRVGGGWIALFATAWLGIWMAQLTPIQLLLPTQVEKVPGLARSMSTAIHAAAGNDWVYAVVAFGIISGIAGACALIAYPLTGALSDRTTSRFGRRRPWILGGTVLFAAALAILGAQDSIVGIGVFWSLAIIGFCVVTASITATISDQVPVNQRGFVSGWISAPQAIGTILGLLLVVVLALTQVVGYLLVAILVVVLVLPFVLTVPDQPLRPELRPRFSLLILLQGFWINPLRHPDFGWTLLGRILVNLGNALGTTLLLYFLQYGLHETADGAQGNLLVLTGIYLVFFIVAALGFGRLSDAIGRRKVFVYVSAYLQALAALLLAFVQDINIAFIAAGLLGFGYGCYMSVDQALATQVLPDAHSRGKDLGIMNIATAVPQAVGPLLGAFIVLWFSTENTSVGVGAAADTATQSSGFAALFVASAIAAVLGGLAMAPIKSVK
ncbi:MFS transporter [Galbitalea soli]|uniref:MFS transporter n=1 Tax=Galbitalea soli TaxID=1268042 RepID=A0A7C9TQE5_9MICO|nr:MFS transporter [Galbitalea soli]NEM90680.1 MFS transporter [Galbitalea soli]NYJ31398.1 MFS family permease [Galbitalea soli]